MHRSGAAWKSGKHDCAISAARDIQRMNSGRLLPAGARRGRQTPTLAQESRSARGPEEAGSSASGYRSDQRVRLARPRWSDSKAGVLVEGVEVRPLSPDVAHDARVIKRGIAIRRRRSARGGTFNLTKRAVHVWSE